ncbi:MAG: ArsR family transcriptional regulator [Rhodospirillaceae bacterium]|nr:ArsR family transcriptional regulator [Rhodospirillaceae bacterium]
MTERERQILALLREDPMLSVAAIARRLKTSAAAVSVHLSALRQQGEILGRGHVLKPEGRVIVVGGANMDFKCQARDAMVLGTSNPGHVSLAVGGVGCNIARNLAKLGVPVALMTVVGQDEFGARILREARAAGIDVSLTLLSTRPTGTYAALLDADGELTAAVSAMEAMDDLTAAHIAAREAAFRQAALVVADCNLGEAALDRLAAICAAAKVRLAIDAVSTPKARRLSRLLRARRPIHLLALNRDEVAALTGRKVRTESDLRAAVQALHRAGIAHVVVGLGPRGVLASSAEPPKTTRVAAAAAPLVDVTGGGDAALAGTVFGLLQGQDLAEAARWGQAAAAMTVSATETVSPALSAEALQAALRKRAGSKRTRR